MEEKKKRGRPAKKKEEVVFVEVNPTGNKPNPVGRPSAYDPSRNDEILALMKKGASKVMIASTLDISRSTLYEWINPESDYYNKEFSDILAKGQTHAQAYLERQGLNNLQSKDFNGTLYKFIMATRFKEDYTETQKIEHGNIDDQPLKFSQIVVPKVEK